MISHGSDSTLLSLAECTALSHAEAIARRGEDDARARVFAFLARAGCTPEQYAEAMDCVMAHARIVIHFHPDRPGRKGAIVAEALLDEGVYRNQFETGLSSGSVSAFPGGERGVWEKTLFGGAYHEEGVTASHRPKYGALELVRYSDGPIPRFGSCYLVLRQRITKHCSFTFMGSEHPQATERLWAPSATCSA